MRRKIIRSALIAFGLLIAIVAAYVIYVFADYHRFEDRLVLTPEGEASAGLETDTVYRAVSYNVGFGAYSADYSFFMDGGTESRARSAQAVNDNITGAVTTAASYKPDLLMLQEVDINGTRSHHVNEYQLASSLLSDFNYTHTFAQNYDSPYLFWPLLEPHGANQSGLAFFSRFPISEAVRRSLPIEESVMKLVDLDRCYSVQRIPTQNGKELVVYHLHLSAYTSDGTIAEEQLKMLFEDMQTEYDKGNYILGGGDFNKDLLGNSAERFGFEDAEAYTWAQPIPDSLIPSAFSIIGPYDESNPVPSCRNADKPYGSDTFVVTVDGFIVSDNIEVKESKVIDTQFAYSDHNPVLLDFALSD